MNEHSKAVTLALGDAVALTSVAVLGLLSHDEGVTVTGVARNAGPILLGWFGAAAVTGTYRRPSVRTAVSTWAVGVPAGVVVRTLILRHGFGRSFLSFSGVTMVVTLGLVLSWRGLARAAFGRAAPAGVEPSSIAPTVIAPTATAPEPGAPRSFDER